MLLVLSLEDFSICIANSILPCSSFLLSQRPPRDPYVVRFRHLVIPSPQSLAVMDSDLTRIYWTSSRLFTASIFLNPEWLSRSSVHYFGCFRKRIRTRIDATSVLVVKVCWRDCGRRCFRRALLRTMRPVNRRLYCEYRPPPHRQIINAPFYPVQYSIVDRTPIRPRRASSPRCSSPFHLHEDLRYDKGA